MRVPRRHVVWLNLCVSRLVVRAVGTHPLPMGEKRYFAVALVAVLALGVAGWPTLQRQVQHRSDSEAFHEYVSTYVGGWYSSEDPGGAERDEAWVAAHADAVLAAGQSACEWLGTREDAPSLDPTGASTVAALTERFLDENPDLEVAELSPMGRRRVVYGAWAYLCWWDRRDKTAPVSADPD